jgi:hypothetical protein
MGKEIKNKDDQASQQDDTRTDKEVRAVRGISRRGVLGVFGALAALIGVPMVGSAQESKPEPSEWYNETLYNAVDPSKVPKCDIKEMMKAMSELRNKQIEQDYSDCIHVMNKDRMVDLRGMAIMTPTTLKGSPSVMVRNYS